MSDPTVSVIIPCYNSARYVGETLDSVLAQTYPHWEAVVVDDGSTDESAQIVAQYESRDARIRMIQQDNRGLGGARNTGLEASTGKWLLFLDADDLLMPEMMETVLRASVESPESQVVYYGWAFGSSDVSDTSWVSSPPADEGLRERMYHSSQMPFHAALFRRDAASTIGPFDVHLRHAHDWDYLLRATRANLSFLRLDRALVVYRMTPASLSRRPITFFDDTVTVLRRAHSYDDRLRLAPDQGGQGCPCDMKYPLALWAVRCAASAVILGRMEDAFALLSKADFAASPPDSAMAGEMRYGLLFTSGTTLRDVQTLWLRYGGLIWQFLLRWGEIVGDPALPSSMLSRIGVVPGALSAASQSGRIAPETVKDLARMYGARALGLAALRRCLSVMLRWARP